jgi:hypothetical protein
MNPSQKNRERCKRDPAFARKQKESIAYRSVLKKIRLGGTPSDEKVMRIFSCKTAFLIEWLRMQLKEGWTFQNYGSRETWNIDHIKPRAFFNYLDDKEVKESNHWSNIAPADPMENDTKRNEFGPIDQFIWANNQYYRNYVVNN